MKRISPAKMAQLISAAKKSEHLKKFCLANTAVSDKEVKGLVDLLKTTKTLKSLNVESNFLTPDFLCKLIKATVKTQSLTEIHAENQRASVLGNRVEMEIMSAVEDNDSLLRVGLPLQSMEARSRVAEALERNYERRESKAIVLGRRVCDRNAAPN